MKIKYTVHSCTREDALVKAIVNDVERDVKVAGLALELVSDCGGMGHTFRLIPDDFAKAEAEFAPGTAVTLTITADTHAPKGK